MFGGDVRRVSDCVYIGGVEFVVIWVVIFKCFMCIFRVLKL